MREIPVGATIRITDASGKTLERRAVSGVVMGTDFPVVWACSEDEWRAAEREDRLPDGTPWPAEDVDMTASGGQA